MTVHTPIQIFFTVSIKVKLLSCVRLFATSWTVAYQVLPSMGFSRQDYWFVIKFVMVKS